MLFFLYWHEINSLFIIIIIYHTGSQGYSFNCIKRCFCHVTWDSYKKRHWNWKCSVFSTSRWQRQIPKRCFCHLAWDSHKKDIQTESVRYFVRPGDNGRYQKGVFVTWLKIPIKRTFKQKVFGIFNVPVTTTDIQKECQ